MKVGDRPVFTTNGMQPIAGFSHAKNLIDAEIAEIDPEMAHWTNHDLRRTMSTVMQPLGVSSRIIDLLQDHRDPEVSKTALHYQHWQFVEEKREAVALYGCYLQGVIDNNDSYRDLVKIGRAHVCTPVTNAHLVCRLLFEKTKFQHALTNLP